VKFHLEEISLEEANVSCVLDFACSCVEMLVLKVDSQVNQEYEEPLDMLTFAKILEESVSFESELYRDFLGNLPADIDVTIPPLVSTVFSQPRALEAWLNLERDGNLKSITKTWVENPN